MREAPRQALGRHETLGSATGTVPGVVAADALAGIERWFVDRGLPHFVERHDTAAEIWARALPLLVAAYLLLGLNALDLGSGAWPEPGRGRVRASSALSSTWVVANRCAAGGWFERPHDIGPAELAVFIVVPAMPSLARRPVGRRRQTVVMAVGILALLWAVTSYGVPRCCGWAWQRTTAQLALLAQRRRRALPLLLLFTTFLFINAEVWQVAGTLTGVVYVAMLGIFFVLGAFVRAVPGPGADAAS